MTPIKKPSSFSLDKFKSKRPTALGSVETLLGALPCLTLKEAGDFVRLHDDEENFWSPELCFVPVPVKGEKRDVLHLIDEEIAMRFLDAGKIKRFRLALATKPYDVHFLAKVPSTNLDNSWNESSLEACEQAKAHWVEVTSGKVSGVERYSIKRARDSDAFPTPIWPTQSLAELISASFPQRTIDHDKHPALLRLIGAKQTTS